MPALLSDCAAKAKPGGLARMKVLASAGQD
nr:hypothetical protein SHINE37_41976 [Rhizobiaceae bacterium]